MTRQFLENVAGVAAVLIAAAVFMVPASIFLLPATVPALIGAAAATNIGYPFLGTFLSVVVTAAAWVTAAQRRSEVFEWLWDRTLICYRQTIGRVVSVFWGTSE